MATTHLIAINGDLLDRIEHDPETFAVALAAACRNGNNQHLLNVHYGARHLTESANGVRGCLLKAMNEWWPEIKLSAKDR